MVDEGAALGVPLGVYAGYYGWIGIVRAGYDYPHKKGLPLWYAHYDGVKAFSDWATTEHGGFGGWTQPHTKQYLGPVDVPRNT